MGVLHYFTVSIKRNNNKLIVLKSTHRHLNRYVCNEFNPCTLPLRLCLEDA
jgi:hypothetical protein